MSFKVNEKLSSKLKGSGNIKDYTEYVNQYSNHDHFHPTDADRKKFTREAFIDLKTKLHSKNNRHLFVVDLILSKDFRSLSNKNKKMMECKNVKKRVKKRYFGYVKDVKRRFNKTMKLAKNKKNTYNHYINGKTKKSIKMG